jgi:hypothetical protein
MNLENTDRPPRPDALIALLVRTAMSFAYVVLAWALCHDGTSADDARGLVVVGVIFIVLSAGIGWILRGPGQVDRE